MKLAVTQYIVRMFQLVMNLAAVVAHKACKLLVDALVVLAILTCVLLMLPDLWSLLLVAHRLAAEVQTWRDSGPHNSLLGRMRVRLAAAGLLAAPRDPLTECGVPSGEGWRHVLRLMFLPDGRLSCMEKQVRLAWEEHMSFTAALLLAATCLGLLALLAICLLGWAYAGRSPERRSPHSPEGNRGDPPPNEDDKGEEGEDAPPPDAEGGEVLPEVKEVEAAPIPDAEGEEVLPEVEEAGVGPLPLEAGDNDPPEEEGQGHLLLQEASLNGDALPQTPPDPEREGVQQEGRREVRHSMHLPPCLRERLEGPQECFLEDLRRRHSVLIFMDAARKRVHVKGAQEDVVECCGAVRALLAEWRRRHAAGEE